MKDRVFLDTNIIVYAHDHSSGEKHAAAKAIMEQLWENRRGIISAQVLQEFYVCVTKKIPRPLPIKDAKSIIEHLSTWHVVANDKDLTLKAIDIQERHRFSFWDSLIIQAAFQGQASILLSEDLPSGQAVEDVMILNPFCEEWNIT
jgi:predicted nucleic acid-binding protein